MWVKVVFWCTAFIAVAGMIYYPASSLYAYWQDRGTSESQNIGISKPQNQETVQPDSSMAVSLKDFIESPTRLDTTDVAVSVYDLSAGCYVARWHDEELMPPASCLKLLTAACAMKRLGLGHKYHERVLLKRDDVIIQLDDDPLLESLKPLVDAISENGIREIEGKVILNLMRTDTLRAHRTAAVWDIPYYKTPLLLKGAPRVEREIKLLLRQKGIKYNEVEVVKGIQPLPGAHEIKDLATSMQDVLIPMLIHSSNIKADALFWHLQHYGDRYQGMCGTGENIIEAFLREDLKYNTEGFVVNDGSGLSPDNRVTADFLLAILRYCWKYDDMKEFLLDKALATPGSPIRHGSLLGRLSAQKYRGRVFCKTGTLTSHGGSSLAGYVHSQNGHWYAFVVINRDSPVAECRLYQDKLCKILVL